jgi:DNA-binding protein
MKSELSIPFAPIEREIKKNTTQRVSADAVKQATEEIISIGKKITLKAIDLSKHSGRKTLKNKDIKLSYEYYGK